MIGRMPWISQESPKLYWKNCQKIEKMTHSSTCSKDHWVGRPSRLKDHYGWQPWFFTLYLTWVERPATDLLDATTTTSFHRPKEFFTLYWTCLNDHRMSTSFIEWELSYPACLIWLFSPWQIVPLAKPERGVDTHRHAPSVNRGADWLEGQSL